MQVQSSQQQGDNQIHQEHVIFVGDIQEKWLQSSVTAKQILQKAGVQNPHQFVLEALNHRGGIPVAEFGENDIVNLDDQDRKFFRITPGGGGRS